MIRAIVTDIEGTTSSIRFVHDVLFPYAAENLAEFIRTNADDAEVREQLEAVAELADLSATDVEDIIEQLQMWIREDKKITPLKALQGMIWQHGYQQGHFKGHVYDDAAQSLRAWFEQGIMLYVYSSGSVQAQKLIFGFTEFGDLTPLFSGYFDTRIGAKREESSYREIVTALELEAGDILFLSDICEELDAARAAGMKTCQLLRPLDASAAGQHPSVNDFSQIDLACF